jgi:tRNA dimethylallyltransferase
MDPAPTAYRPLIAIFGPTASGKSALAMQVCETYGGEIVTADSRQVYRHMDIGTDKPSKQDQARIPHHMIDLVDPDESYTLALYQEQAYRAIDDILARGKLPVLAGGTPLYVNAVIEGWNIPRVEPNLSYRDVLFREAEEQGSEVLHDRLRALDPDAATAILSTNTRRIVRALEVIELTGQPISAQQTKTFPPYSILPILLSCDRTILYERIDSRVDRYVERGLVAEVSDLHDMGYAYTLPSMSGIGYRQIGEYLEGKATLEHAVQRIKWDTHAFVRHQANWFRRVNNGHVLDVTHEAPAPEALRLVEAFLSVVQAPKRIV